MVPAPGMRVAGSICCFLTHRFSSHCLLCRCTVQVNENSTVGTAVLPAAGSGPVQAYSKDSWAVLTYAWASQPSNCVNCFAIDSNTAAVTLGSAGGALNFNTATSYNLTVRVTYVGIGMTDTAAVTVWVREINKPSIWAGLYNATTGVAMTSIVISESTPANTAIGRVAFTDPNTGFPWNARVYGIVPAYYGADLFSINSTSGVVSIGGAPLAWWDAPSYQLSVSCSDTDLFNTPITTVYTIIVSITQVNTVSITSIGVPSGTPASFGVNASGSVLYQTNGGTVVEIYGSGFGPTARYLAANSLPLSSTAISASYGPAAVPAAYNATSCSVTVANSVIRCTTVAGVGLGHIWSLVVAQTWPASSGAALTTAYFPPFITFVNKWDAVRNTYASSNFLSTEGSELVAIDGVNLSPATTADLVWQYWSAATPTTVYTGSCRIGLAPFQQLWCVTSPGVGAALSFQVRVGNQWSAVFNASTVAYAAPIITSMSIVAVVSSEIGLMDTRGGDLLIFNGTNLGPAGTPSSAFTALYSSNLGSPSVLTFAASSCYVPDYASSVAVFCTTAPGAGTGLGGSLNVGGQLAMTPITAKVSYRKPVMYTLSGRGFANAETVGGQAVLITGDQFGPVSALGGAFSPLPNITAMYGKPTDVSLRYTATSCSVTTAQTVITCLTAPGVSFGHVWQVTVAGQTAPRLLTYLMGYAAPVTAIFSGLGADLANTTGGQVVVIDGTASLVLLCLRYLLCAMLLCCLHLFCRGQLRASWNADRPRHVRSQRHWHCVSWLHARHPSHGGALTFYLFSFILLRALLNISC